MTLNIYSAHTAYTLVQRVGRDATGAFAAVAFLGGGVGADSFLLPDRGEEQQAGVCAHASARVFVCERPPIRLISWQQSSPPHR